MRGDTHIPQPLSRLEEKSPRCQSLQMQTPYRGCWLGSGVSCLVMLGQVVTGREDGGPRLLVKTFGLGISVGLREKHTSGPVSSP